MPYDGVKAGPPPSTARPAPKIPEKRASAKTKAREEAANGIGQIIAFGAMVTGNLADAGAVGHHWPGMAHEAAVLAETQPKIASALDYLLEVGPYGNLIIAALPFAAQLLVNHKLVKPEAMAGAGVVHPDALEAQVRTDMVRKATEAMKMQQAAEEEMAAMQREMANVANGEKPE